MRKTIVLAIILFTISLGGCATPKFTPAPVFDMPSGAKIGFVNFLPATMTHYHFGTIKLTNSTRDYEVDWKIPEFLNEQVIMQAKSIGYQCIIIDPSDDLKLKLMDRVIKDGDSFVLNPTKAPFFQEIATKYGIDMLFIFEPVEMYLDNPGALLAVKGYGVATGSQLGIRHFAHAFAMVSVQAICLNPLSLTRGNTSLKSESLGYIERFGLGKSLSEEELSAVKAVVQEKIRTMVAGLLINANLNKTEKQ